VPATALLLALAAAGVHALWNLLLAENRDPQAATAVALAVGAVVFAPLALTSGSIESGAWPYVALSAAFELAYFALLGAAYARAELSVVYPISRGLAPVLLVPAGAILLGADLEALQTAGIALVALGIVLVRGLARPEELADVLLAAAIACSIAGYTLADKQGLRDADPLPYLEAVIVLPALLYLAAMTRARGGAALRRLAGTRIAVAGLGMFGAYLLVLEALQRADAAPVAAVRETSVVIATALAAVTLHERVGVRRLAGAVVVVAGVSALALA
jgi:drug/metabolite transporter (DMT)-like permease